MMCSSLLPCSVGAMLFCTCSIVAEMKGSAVQGKAAQQTRGVGPMLSWRRASVVDNGPTSAQHWANATCLLAVQCSAVQCSAVQCSAVQDSAV